MRAKHISRCLELAILLEVSADKPGNVNLVTGFEGTRYEHFLASAVAAASHFESAACQGIAVSQGALLTNEIGLGQIIRDCIRDVEAWQHGGNTVLGTVILLCPIAVAAGMTPIEENIYEVLQLREHLKLVVESTTPADAVDVFEAIKIANPSGLNETSYLDVNDPESTKRIMKENISLYRIFEFASQYDSVCSEWVSSYRITFDVAYPFLTKLIREEKDLNVATIHTFLEVLAKCPDTFIARKVGAEKAREISGEAESILKLGGLETPDGKKSLREFDLMLRKSSNLLNPGTTADIIAATLALAVLGGYRP